MLFKLRPIAMQAQYTNIENPLPHYSPICSSVVGRIFDMFYIKWMPFARLDEPLVRNHNLETGMNLSIYIYPL